MNINHQIQKKTKGLKCEMKNKKFFLISGIAVCMLGVGLFSIEGVAKEAGNLEEVNISDSVVEIRINKDREESANRIVAAMEEIINRTAEAMEKAVGEKKVILKDVEGYEYLKQMDLASADGNVYPVMVPKDLVIEEGNRFVVYRDNGFCLSMYARELFDGETLTDFMDFTSKFTYEYLDRDYFINVKKTDRIEKDGLIYQICTADRVLSEGITYPEADLIAAIPLGGTDILSFELSFQEYSCNQEGIKYLEEIGKYYKIPVEVFIELIEEYAK